MKALDRTTGLGGTDVAAIVGVSPYASRHDVQAEKLGLVPPRDETLAMRLGSILEPAIVMSYEELTGTPTKPGGELRHRRWPFLYGHPDRRIPYGILEAKARGDLEGWGEPGTDEVPPMVKVQTTWYTGLSRRQYADVVLFHGTRGLDVYRVEHNPVLYRGLVEAAVDFWQRHVERAESIEPDGSDGAWRQLRKAAGGADDEVVATLEQQQLVDRYLEAKAQLNAAEGAVELARQQIAVSLGAHKALVGPGFRGSWVQRSGQVDYEAVITRYHDLVLELFAALEMVAPAHRPMPQVLTEPDWWKRVRKPAPEPHFEIRRRKQ